MNVVSQQFEVAAGGRAAAISVRGLAKSFKIGSPVFSGVSFDIAAGSIVALLGSNGTGKSTLLRCLPRLISPDAGSVAVMGEAVTASRRDLHNARTKLGFVFQKHNLVGRLTALSNVIHGAQARGYGFRAWGHVHAPSALRSEALQHLEQVGMAPFAVQRADSLSGGQSQRVAIARALMQRPAIVLADEPAASLDPQAGDEIMQLFSGLMRIEKKTVLFTTHNLHHALEFADRIIVIGGGGIRLDAPSKVLDEALLRACYV